MKLTGFLLTAATALVAFAFTTADVEFKVDKQQSKVGWVGKKVTGEHKGMINISDGKLVLDGKTIKGGSFEIDMNSVTCTDLTDAETNKKLIGHLKSDDFFGTAKFAKSTFVITKISPIEKDQYKVNGDLTIKGITKPVEFPATIQISNDIVKAAAKISVDRTKFDIKYGSGSFFDNLGDKAIDNDFILNVDLVAKK